LLGRLREQLIGLGSPLGGKIDDWRSRLPIWRRNGERWGRRGWPVQKQVSARDHRAGQGCRQRYPDFPAEVARWRWSVADGWREGFPIAGRAGGRFDDTQRGGDFLAVLKPLVRVFFQQFVQQRLKAGQFGRQFRDRGGDVHHRQSEAVFGGIGNIAGQHFVEQHAEAVQVGAGVYRLAANLLRAHVAWRADGQTGAGHDRGAAESFGDAEVGQYRAAVFAGLAFSRNRMFWGLISRWMMLRRWA